MKLVIQVGEVIVEVEGESLKVTKVAGPSGTPIEIATAISREEKLEAAVADLNARWQRAVPLLRQLKPGEHIEI